MEAKIHYNTVHFNFDWSWIKDKQIVHRGNVRGGVLMITDEEGNMIKMYGYELL